MDNNTNDVFSDENNNDSEVNFDNFPQEDVDAFSPPSDVDGSGEDDLFSSEGVFDPDDSEVSFGGDGFGDSDENGEDNFFSSGDAEDSGFGFDSMPSPESVDIDSMTGDAEEEFGDFGDSDSSSDSSDVFADGEIENMASEVYDSEEDVTDDDYGLESESEDYDPFDELDDIEDDALASANVAAASSKGISSVVKYGAIGILVVGVGFVGYTSVLPMFMPGPSVVVAQNEAVPVGNNFPTSLPSLPVEVATPVITSPTPVIPQMVIEPIDQPGSPSVLSPLDMGSNVSVSTQNLPTVVLSIPESAQSTPVFVSPTENAPAVVLPIDEIVGGPRGGVDAMKKDVMMSGSKEFDDLSGKIDDVILRLSKMEAKVSSFEASFNMQVGMPNGDPMKFGIAPSMAGQTTFSPIDMPSDSLVMSTSMVDIMPPLKPEIMDGVVLRGVAGNTGWIGVNGDVVKVEIGGVIANAGTVESFQNYRGRWIAVTDKGIILPK